jgi:hypothetical protein
VKVGVIQSNYIPWRGYFDFIDSVDLFVIYDDVKYTKNDWRNRNRIKTPHGLNWLTVPVNYRHLNQLICETTIDYTHDWQKSHIKKFSFNYQKSPFFEDALCLLTSAISQDFTSISQLNLALIKLINEYLEIKTPLVVSQDYAVTGTKTDRLVSLLQKIGATTYVSGPAAQSYLDENRFRETEIGLEYKTYDYAPYNQLWGEFVGSVSILDLIANQGKESKDFLTSQSPNILVVKPPTT